MTTVTAKQLRENLSDIIDRVEAGEEVVVIRHSKPVMRLVAEAGGHASPYAGDAVGERLSVLRRGLAVKIPPKFQDPAVGYKEMRDELMLRDSHYGRQINDLDAK